MIETPEELQEVLSKPDVDIEACWIENRGEPSSSLETHYISPALLRSLLEERGRLLELITTAPRGWSSQFPDLYTLTIRVDDYTEALTGDKP